MTPKPREQVYQAFQEYLKEINRHISNADYTELTLRTPFENLVNALIRELGYPHNIRHEGKKMPKFGAPDFTIFKGAAIGYIEAKDVDTSLTHELQSLQIQKYSAAIPNIILTNYRDFILIRDKQQVDRATLFPFPLKNYKHVTEADIRDFLRLFSTFLDYYIPTIREAKELAEALARRARLLKDLAQEQLEEDLSIIDFYRDEASLWNKKVSSIWDFHDTLQELIEETSIKQGVETTVDAYAQTITYGLFLARYDSSDRIERETAYRRISQNIPIIRTIFRSIADEDKLPSNVSWILDELVNVLNATEIEEAMSKVSENGKGFRDPFYMFYEHFLDLYDPDRRKKMGVYYTPSPVVHFITNSLHLILKSVFDKRFGLSDNSVTLLDPAVGTGAFLSSAIVTVFDEMRSHGFGGLGRKVENHILKNFCGFEVLITPYVIAHIKLHDILKQYREFSPDDRIQIYLTDALNPSDVHKSKAWFRDLSQESRTADEIKTSKKILVILGNPPYSGESSNKGHWITNLLKNGYELPDGRTDGGYFEVDGRRLDEKNPKWLNDDYVKFIRFAQWKIDSSGEGVVGLITNHGYLDNPSFRGMRFSLLKSFDRIYILNLHGNANKQERSPDGSKDENVFNIRQGVAISLLIKSDHYLDKKVFYADLYGEKLKKYAWLDDNTIETVKWTEITPEAPYFFFIPTDHSLLKEYENGWKINEIFPVNSVGIVTARDKLTIQWTPDDVADTVLKFAKLEPAVARDRYNLGRDAMDWKITSAQEDLVESELSKDKITPILYRPFDVRFTYYTGKSMGFICRPRAEVMTQMKQNNVGLIFHKREELPVPYAHFLVTDKMIEHVCLSIKTTCYLAPLYLYEDDGGGKREPNLNLELIKALTQKYGRAPDAEEIFYYIYAIAYSSSFRATYNELLRYDVPRIPFKSDYNLFLSLARVGEKLVNLHLMKQQIEPSTEFCEAGSRIISSAPKYEGGKIYINRESYFGGVPEYAWNFYIGAYQVLNKWLSSRKGRELTYSEIDNFLQVVEVIKKTEGYIKEIDDLVHF